MNNDQYFNTWITRILINKCYDIIKQNRKISYINEKMQLEEEQYYDEFSVKEISEMLNVAEGTIKSRLSRAREKIYNIIKKEGGKVEE